MRIKHVKLYQFDELPTEEAKERAREWWREASAGDTDFAESVTDDFMTAAQACGFDLTGTSHRYNNMTCEWDYDPVETDSDVLDSPGKIIDQTEDFKELCRDLAHWFYRSLEREYEYVNSAECIDETLRCNEYEFTEDGERA